MSDLTTEDRHTIEEELGIRSKDRRKVRFYVKPVIDQQASFAEAKRKADEIAQERSDRAGKLVDPDYSPENLKRLGAVQRYKDQIYIEVRQPGSKDSASRVIRESDKTEFPKAWAIFEASQTEQDGHDVRLLPGVTEAVALELRALQITTVEELAEASVPERFQTIQQTAIKFRSLCNVTDQTSETEAGHSPGNVREERPALRIAPDRQQQHAVVQGGPAEFSYTFSC